MDGEYCVIITLGSKTNAIHKDNENGKSSKMPEMVNVGERPPSWILKMKLLPSLGQKESQCVRIPARLTEEKNESLFTACLLYTSPSPRD